MAGAICPLKMWNCYTQSVRFHLSLCTYFTKSPSNEPGFLLLDNIAQPHVLNSSRNSTMERQVSISKANFILRLQNQERPNVRSCLIASEHKLSSTPNMQLTQLITPFKSHLLKQSLQNAIMQTLLPLSTAGSVFKHRKKKMRKHKFKKRMREQRLKAFKNQTFRPFVAKKTENK